MIMGRGAWGFLVLMFFIIMVLSGSVGFFIGREIGIIEMEEATTVGAVI